MKNFYYFETARDGNDVYNISDPLTRHTCPPHIHRQIEILYVLDGCNRATINNTTVMLTKNQLAIADSFDVHSWEHIDDTSICIIIPYSALSTYIEAKNNRSLKSNFILDSGIGVEFKEIIELMCKYKNDKFVLNGLTNAFLGLIIKHIDLQKSESPKQKLLVSEILSYIEENYQKELTLEQTAKKFAYSKYYFSKLFNQLLGCHFESYINMIRTQHVLFLITEKKFPVIDAIMQSGFSSVPTFYRYFKQNYNCSITTYLKTRNLN